MDSESQGLAESFSTLLTLERLLFGVNISTGRDRQHHAMLFMNACTRSPPTDVKVFVGSDKGGKGEIGNRPDKTVGKNEKVEGSFGFLNKFDR